jgi:hypothetical protein
MLLEKEIELSMKCSDIIAGSIYSRNVLTNIYFKFREFLCV